MSSTTTTTMHLPSLVNHCSMLGGNLVAIGHCDIGNNNVRVGVALVTDYAFGVECIVANAPLPRQCPLFFSAAWDGL